MDNAINSETPLAEVIPTKETSLKVSYFIGHMAIGSNDEFEEPD